MSIFSMINAALIHFATNFSLKSYDLTGDEVFNPHINKHYTPRFRAM